MQNLLSAGAEGDLKVPFSFFLPVGRDGHYWPIPGFTT